MRMYMSGTPRNDPYQPVENRLCTHRLFSMHGEYERAVLRWLKDVRNGIHTAADFFKAYPQHRDYLIKKDDARRVKQAAFGGTPQDWDSFELMEHVCQTTKGAPYPKFILLDSGAFTAWNKGEKVTVDDVRRKYHGFISQADGLFEEIWMINLDVIPGERGRDPTEDELKRAVEVSDINFEILVKEFGNYIQPVFHQGESDERLKEVIEQVRGRSNYICVSPRNDLPEGARVKWSDEAHQAIREYAPEIRTHGLATTGNKMIRQVPWYSGDSAAWVQHGGFGMVDILHRDQDIPAGWDPRYKNYFISLDNTFSAIENGGDLSPQAMADLAAGGRVPLAGGKVAEATKHFDACTTHDQEVIERRIAQYGFHTEVARWDSRVRNLICMGELGAYAHWASHIEKRPLARRLFEDAA